MTTIKKVFVQVLLLLMAVQFSHGYVVYGGIYNITKIMNMSNVSIPIPGEYMMTLTKQSKQSKYHMNLDVGNEVGGMMYVSGHNVTFRSLWRSNKKLPKNLYHFQENLLNILPESETIFLNETSRQLRLEGPQGIIEFFKQFV